jgi:cytochrome c oxidase subunit 4
MAHLSLVSEKNMAHLSSVSEKNMAHLSSVRRKNMAHEEGQQHPIKLYLVVWGWLFVLSTCSYLVDYFGFQGYLRWSLILLFMIVKAGLIVAIFMHMAWERLALMYAILAPPGAVLLFVAIMAFESDYTHLTRVAFFGTANASIQEATLEPQTSGSGTGTATAIATAPPDQLNKEAKKEGRDFAKAEVKSKGDNAALSGSASATKEAGKTASASGSTAGVAAVRNDSAAAAKAPELKLYTLKPGDTLWKIAETEYGPGHGGKYHLIFEANKSLLSRPGKVHPGQVLRIPPLSG